ncbi:hypothetical protein [Effusibacillus consociatus]|uniref:Uncharacterized protein n=1 Tax=Effusibacillus consociatus TaxID=1117041 RepID=A0ABV9PUV4_9BACL
MPDKEKQTKKKKSEKKKRRDEREKNKKEKAKKKEMKAKKKEEKAKKKAKKKEMKAKEKAKQKEKKAKSNKEKKADNKQKENKNHSSQKQQSIKDAVAFFRQRANLQKQLKKKQLVMSKENFDVTENEEMENEAEMENENAMEKEVENEDETESEKNEDTLEYAVPLNENWNSLSTGTNLYDSIFGFQVDTPNVWPDPTVWNIVYAAVPADYTIPDPVFINELSQRVAWNLVQETLPEDNSSNFNNFIEALIQPPGQTKGEGTISDSQ